MTFLSKSEITALYCILLISWCILQQSFSQDIQTVLWKSSYTSENIANNDGAARSLTETVQFDQAFPTIPTMALATFIGYSFRSNAVGVDLSISRLYKNGAALVVTVEGGVELQQMQYCLLATTSHIAGIHIIPVDYDLMPGFVNIQTGAGPRSFSYTVNYSPSNPAIFTSATAFLTFSSMRFTNDVMIRVSYSAVTVTSSSVSFTISTWGNTQVQRLKGAILVISNTLQGSRGLSTFSFTQNTAANVDTPTIGQPLANYWDEVLTIPITYQAKPKIFFFQAPVIEAGINQATFLTKYVLGMSGSSPILKVIYQTSISGIKQLSFSGILFCETNNDCLVNVGKQIVSDTIPGDFTELDLTYTQGAPRTISINMAYPYFITTVPTYAAIGLKSISYIGSSTDLSVQITGKTSNSITIQHTAFPSKALYLADCMFLVSNWGGLQSKYVNFATASSLFPGTFGGTTGPRQIRYQILFDPHPAMTGTIAAFVMFTEYSFLPGATKVYLYSVFISYTSTYVEIDIKADGDVLFTGLAGYVVIYANTTSTYGVNHIEDQHFVPSVLNDGTIGSRSIITTFPIKLFAITKPWLFYGISLIDYIPANGYYLKTSFVYDQLNLIYQQFDYDVSIQTTGNVLLPTFEFDVLSYCASSDECCSVGCMQCSSITTCLQCQSGYALLSTASCALQCPGGQVVIGGVCAENCGDGIKSLTVSDDYCDDGNLVNGDGCSPTCIVETGYVCFGGGPTSADICKVGMKLRITQNPKDHQIFILSFETKTNFNIDLKTVTTVNFNVTTKLDYTYKFTKIDDYTYHLEFETKKTIKDENLRIVFTDVTAVVDVNNNPVMPRTFNIPCTVPYLPAGQKEAVKGMQAAMGGASWAAGISGIMMIMSSNPTIAFGLINILQAFFYFIVINVEYPYNVQMFWRVFAVGRLDFLPNPLAGLIGDEEKESVYSPPKFQENGLDGLFILNAGGILFVAVFLGIGYFLIRLGIKYPKKFSPRILAFLVNQRKALEWSGMLKFWIASYLEINMACFLQINRLVFTSFGKVVSSLLAILALLADLWLIYLIFKKIRYQNKLHTQIYTKYEGVITEYHRNKRLNRYFQVILLVRRFATSFSLVFLYNFPYVEMSMLMAINIVPWIATFKFIPYKSKTDRVVMLSQEFAYFVIHVLVCILVRDNFTHKYNEDQLLNIGWAIIFACVLSIFFAIIMMIGQQFVMVWGFFKWLKKYLANRKQNKKNNQTKADSESHRVIKNMTIINPKIEPKLPDFGMESKASYWRWNWIFNNKANMYTVEKETKSSRSSQRPKRVDSLRIKALRRDVGE